MSSRQNRFYDNSSASDYDQFLRNLSIQSKINKAPLKSDEEIRKEKLEQGFCLYFNTSLFSKNSTKSDNLPLPKASSSVPSKGRTRSAPIHNQNIFRKTWYKDGGNFRILDQEGRIHVNDDSGRVCHLGSDNNPGKVIEEEISDSKFDKLIISSHDIDRLSDSLKIDDLPRRKNSIPIYDDLVIELPHMEEDVSNINNDPVERVVQRTNLLTNVQFQRLRNALKCIHSQINSDNELPTLKKEVESAPSMNSSDLHLVLRIKSNYGDKDNVGLTGIQFVEDNKEVFLQNIFLDKLSNLAVSVLKNGSNKTTKRRHMWTCPTSELPLDIHLKVKTDKLSRLSVKIWNFNVNKMLDIGVKDFEIYKVSANTSMSLLYKGVLNKGCGNPVFNYESLVKLSSSDRGDSDFLSSLYTMHLELKESNDVDDSNSKSEIDFSSSPDYKIGSALANSLLEKSWNSISFFDRINAGRISTCESSRKRTIEKFSSLDIGELLPEHSLKEENFGEDTLEPVTLLASKEVPLESWTDWASLNSKKRRKPCPDVLKIEEVSNLTIGINLINLETYDPSFIIKELPVGKELVIDILSTWADQFYVGLTGIEVFNIEGNEIGKISQIEADPSNINVLPEYEDDPRIVQNLIDSMNQTRDDIHMWLTPFTEFGHHFIKLAFDKEQTLAMVRLWNYNKSRVHASRGAKDVVFYLDKQCIFQGEISRATGLEPCNSQIDDCNETILFTTDEQILEKVAENDSIYRLTVLTPIEEVSFATIRPKTTQKTPDFVTAQSVFEAERNEKDLQAMKMNLQTVEKSDTVIIVNENSDVECETFDDNFIVIQVLSRWCEKEEGWLAFDAIQLLDEQFNPVEISDADYYVDNIKCEDSILNMIGTNSEVQNSWFGAFSIHHKHEFRFKPKTVKLNKVKHMQIWNCNSSPEECSFGIKMLLANVNNQEVLHLIRKGPGHCTFDYGQLISLEHSPLDKHVDCDLPFGFIFQLNIYISWSDLYYVGLNGVKLLDENCKEIHVEGKQVFASPSSVNDLSDSFSQTCKDVRTPDKLVDGIVSGVNCSSHSWLAPILPDQINKLYFVFDEPKYVSGIQIWNYSKTPERGVKDVAILVDGQIIQRYTLPKALYDAASHGCGIIPMEKETREHSRSCTISFDNELFEKHKIKYDNLSRDASYSASQNIILTNVEDVLEKPNISKKAYINQALRPLTSCRALV